MLPGPPWQRPSSPPQRSLTGVVLHIKQDGFGQAYDLSYQRESQNAVNVGRSPNQSLINEQKRTPNHAGQAMFRCPVVSRRHAKITLSSNSAYIIDLNSHHGTYLQKYHNASSSKISCSDPTRLDDGDTVIFGKPVGREDKEVVPVTARVELLSYGGYNPFAAPVAYPALKLSPSASSGRYGLKDDAISVSSSDSDDHLDSGIDSSPRPLERKSTPCFSPFDWRSVISGSLAGDSSSKASHIADASSEEQDQMSDADEDNTPASLPGSFPGYRHTQSSSYAGAQPLEPPYASADFRMYDEEEEDMHLETPPPESPPSDAKMLAELKLDVSTLKEDMRGLGLLRALVTANHRASTSRDLTLTTRVGKLQEELEAVETKVSARFKDMERQVETGEKAFAAVDDLRAELDGVKDMAKNISSVQDEVADASGQIDEIRELVENVQRERDDDEDEMQAGLKTIKAMIRDLHKERENVDQTMKDLADLRTKFDADVEMQLASIADARDAALRDIREAAQSSLSLKRKRSSGFDQQSQHSTQLSSSATEEEDEDYTQPTQPQGRAGKRRRLLSTAGAVTAGAVATWSALAFS